MTPQEKMRRAKPAKQVRLDYDFGGLKKGSLMFVGTPLIIDGYIRAIPFGETDTIPAMRNRLARRRGCDGTCPASTAIFVRTVAEAAVAEMAAGADESEVAPFWRIVEPDSKIAGKLDLPPTWIADRREAEREMIQASPSTQA